MHQSHYNTITEIYVSNLVTFHLLCFVCVTLYKIVNFLNTHLNNVYFFELFNEYT